MLETILAKWACLPDQLEYVESQPFPEAIHPLRKAMTEKLGLRSFEQALEWKELPLWSWKAPAVYEIEPVA